MLKKKLNNNPKRNLWNNRSRNSEGISGKFSWEFSREIPRMNTCSNSRRYPRGIVLEMFQWLSPDIPFKAKEFLPSSGSFRGFYLKLHRNTESLAFIFFFLKNHQRFLNPFLKYFKEYSGDSNWNFHKNACRNLFRGLSRKSWRNSSWDFLL